MTGKALKIITVLVFIFTALGIGVLVVLPNDIFYSQNNNRSGQTRIVIPYMSSGTGGGDWGVPEQNTYADTLLPDLPLMDGEVLAAVLTQNFDDDPIDEHIIACRNLLELEGPISITYIDTDPFSGEYKRIWSTPTAATRPGTISLFAMDIIGDQGISIVLSGLNGAGEETLTVLRKNNFSSPADTLSQETLETAQSFNKIAELRIDGFISILDAERPQGQPCTIAAYSRDYGSSHDLDRVEIMYTYNPVNEWYEQSQYTKVPGAQIEQRRVQELLSGNAETFEQYIEGLWYFVNSQGTPEQEQYIYFDCSNKEIIFYGDEIEQIFIWRNSTPTRYGLYLSTQNSSVTTLKRSIFIELESLDNLRIRVTEDVQLKIGISASWDGVYRKAGSFKEKEAEFHSIPPHIEAVYDGSIGKLTFYKDGVYELSSANSYKKGNYTFFLIAGEVLLELRPQYAGIDRDVYQVQYPDGETGENEPFSHDALTLTRIRLSTRGIQSLHEPAIFLTLNKDNSLLAGY
ncbi:MAG: pallilysin-related adhesin [Spirochaetaceae bacterium]|nr:pallilysin-related adhesin [Spirochaetaceae bacterium]